MGICQVNRRFVLHVMKQFSVAQVKRAALNFPNTSWSSLLGGSSFKRSRVCPHKNSGTKRRGASDFLSYL